jgi:hypothetical protein
VLKILVIPLLTFLIVVIVTACTGTDVDSDGISVEDTFGLSTPLPVFHAGEIFTTKSFTEAGWKQKKEYDTSTVPESTEIWYGFFNQKNIELRFYESHESAMKHGVPLAEKIVKKDSGARIGGVNTVRTGYGAYAVTGNVVMMCELELSSCENLINSLESS